MSSSSESSALSSCSNRCSSPGTNSFSGLRIVGEGSYKCKCVDLAFASVVLENKDSLDPQDGDRILLLSSVFLSL